MLGGRMGDDVGKKKERGREMKAAQEKRVCTVLYVKK
jgi:hypothetical protein